MISRKPSFSALALFAGMILCLSACEKEDISAPVYSNPSEPGYGEFIETVETPTFSGDLCSDATHITLTGSYGLYSGHGGGGYNYIESCRYSTDGNDPTIVPGIVWVNDIRSTWAPVKGWECDKTFDISAKDENGISLPVNVSGCDVRLEAPKTSGKITLLITARTPNYATAFAAKKEITLSCSGH